MGYFSGLASGLKKAWISVKKIMKGVFKEVYNFGVSVVNAAMSATEKIRQQMNVFLHRSRDFLRTVVIKVQPMIAGTLIGAANVLKKAGDKCQILSRNFVLDEELGDYKVMTVKKEVSYDQIPESVRMKMEQNEGEYDNTRELDKALVNVA